MSYSNVIERIVMNIYFITGTSGSGKSTLTKLLKEKLPKNLFEVYDFDENGVPENADKSWRLQTTDFWLSKAQENSLQKKSTIICGISVPAEILASSKKPYRPIYFGFLKISDEIIKERLKARGWPDQLIADNTNWAHKLEEEVKNQKQFMIIDNSECTLEQTANEFITWFDSAK